MSAVIYVRISDDRDGDGLGVARQEADCRALVEREGWELAGVLVDNDRSAYRGKPRPAYRQLLDGLKAGDWSHVVAWHPDRLTRHPKELEALIDLLEATGAHVRTVTAGDWDLTTPTGRMTARVVGAVARHESEHKADRQRRKHRELAEAGKVAGGGPSRPFGFTADRVTIDPIEAVLIREAAQRVLDGEGIRGIVADWAARSVPTCTGAPWHSFTLRRILLAPRTAGFREHGGRLHPAVWAPILDEVTWRRLRAVLSEPGRRASRMPRAYLLTGGMARCGLCDAALVSRPKADGRRCYVCAAPPNFTGCGKIGILADDFDRDVEDRALSVIAAGRIPTGTATPEVEPLLAAIEAAEAQMAELADDYYAHRAITKGQFQSASAAIQGRLERLRAEVARAEGIRVRPKIDRSIADGWAARPMQVRRTVLDALIDRVVVQPTVKGRNFYVKSRVEVTWKV